jgi:hypothetical protein
MALKATVDTLDDVPETVRDFYEESDGRFRLKVEGVEFPEEVKGLKTALERERDARKRIEQEARTLREQIPEGFDPERWEQLTKAEKEREQRKAEEKGEWEKLRGQLQEQHQKQIQEWEGREKTLLSQLDQKIVDEAILGAAAQHDAYAHLLPKYAKDFVKVVEEDGRRRPVVVDERGDRRLNEKGEDMTIPQLVEWMKVQEQYWPLFKGHGVAGGGSSGRSGAGGAHSKKISEMSEAEKVAFVQEHGLDRYKELISAR